MVHLAVRVTGVTRRLFLVCVLEGRGGGVSGSGESGVMREEEHADPGGLLDKRF